VTGSDADRRRALLRVSVGFALLGCSPVAAWLASWRGIGVVAEGMARQGYDLSLTRYADFGWRATFYVTGREHSPTGASGSAFEPTPFRTVQRAVWETLARA